MIAHQAPVASKDQSEAPTVFFEFFEGACAAVCCTHVYMQLYINLPIGKLISTCVHTVIYISGTVTLNAASSPVSSLSIMHRQWDIYLLQSCRTNESCSQLPLCWLHNLVHQRQLLCSFMVKWHKVQEVVLFAAITAGCMCLKRLLWWPPCKYNIYIDCALSSRLKGRLTYTIRGIYTVLLLDENHPSYSKRQKTQEHAQQPQLYD